MDRLVLISKIKLYSRRADNARNLKIYVNFYFCLAWFSMAAAAISGSAKWIAR